MAVAADPSSPTEPPKRPPDLTPTPGMGTKLGDALDGLGDWTLFSLRAASGLFTRELKAGELLRVCAEVGTNSVGVIAVTGAFIGMVLAVQSYHQFHLIGLDTSLGAVIHMSLVKELGPVLSAVMLAGRVGTAMAAQLATMRVTEQIDALACLGVDPVRYLVGPRFLACVLMIPLLTVLADIVGVIGSTAISLHVFHIDSFHYWRHTQNFVHSSDVVVGLMKSVVFGGVLGLICCHRGFHSKAGAEGVGRAATEGFVLSFVAILAIDFLMAMVLNTVTTTIWPTHGGAKVA
jgi:phospholipid/cholesterol/gamma-HCH transport system permease protein